MVKTLDIENSINDRIASETKVLHERNNKVASLKMVLALRSSEYWREYVRTFYWLFLTFEEEVRKIRQSGSGHLQETFEAVHEPLLVRTEKIRQDILFYYDGDKTVLDCPRTPQENAYVEHVRKTAENDPVKLMAYLSVMYLGLFAGGQIIKSKMIKRIGFYPAKAGLTHAQIIEKGTNIFTFDSNDLAHLKQSHRTRFDRVCLHYLSSEEKDKVVEEAKEIFIRNEELISSVQVPSTAVMVLRMVRLPLLIAMLLLISALLYMW